MNRTFRQDKVQRQVVRLHGEGRGFQNVEGKADGARTRRERPQRAVIEAAAVTEAKSGARKTHAWHQQQVRRDDRRAVGNRNAVMAFDHRCIGLPKMKHQRRRGLIDDRQRGAPGGGGGLCVAATSGQPCSDGRTGVEFVLDGPVQTDARGLPRTQQRGQSLADQGIAAVTIGQCLACRE